MNKRFCDVCEKEIPKRDYYYVTIHFRNYEFPGYIKRIDMCEECMLKKGLIDNKLIKYISKHKK